MSITNFVPELWSAAVLMPFEEALVYGQPTVSNRNYEGAIRQMGDTVNITSIARPTIRTYDKTTDLTVEDVTDSEIQLLIDQGDYFNFRVNDVDKVQAAGDFQGPATEEAGFGMAEKVDKFLASLAYANAASANKVGRQLVHLGDGALPHGQVSAYSVAVQLQNRLNKSKVPTQGRYIVIPPDFLSAIEYDDRFVKVANAGTDETLRNGLVARVLGMDVLVSLNVPLVGGSGADQNDLVVTAGTPAALSFAMQITETEALRSQNRFADLVRGLQIYGGKVVRPEAIATATVSFDVHGNS